MRSSLHPPLLLLSLSLLLLSWQPARAQFLTADDFFHSGAQFYISNNIPLAKERVKSGLQIYPDDDKLKKLEQLLNQQQQSQQQQQQNQKDQQQQQQQGQQGKDQDKQQKGQSQDQSGQDKEQQAQKEKEEQAKKDAEKKKEEEKQAQQAEEQKDKSTGETNEVVDAKGAHQMTPKEAKQLLDSQKGNEQYLTMKPKDKQENRPTVKDW